MTRLRVGTRGSELALWQTRWVCDALRRLHRGIEIDEVIIKTHGDAVTDRPFDADWPVGGFVGAIEQALSRGDVDFAVHSYKDLQTAVTPGLVVAAVPKREVSHDVLLTREPVELEVLPAGFRVGTGSPRRAAQFRRLGEIEIVPIRGNVPTRVGKLETEKLDGVVLAAAGVKRLGIVHPFVIDLPTDRFVPAPAQGAWAVQAREGSEAAKMVRLLDHAESRRGVESERSFLAGAAAGCQTPAGALASMDGGLIRLHAELFSDDGGRWVSGLESGDDPVAVGWELADRLKRELVR